MNQSVPVFRGQFLGNATSVDRITSGPVQCLGNKVVLSVTMINASGGSCSTYLDGSYDGVSWILGIGSATITQSALGVGTATKSALDYAFVRVRSETSAAGALALFDATLVFSSQ